MEKDDNVLRATFGATPLGTGTFSTQERIMELTITTFSTIYHELPLHSEGISCFRGYILFTILSIIPPILTVIQISINYIGISNLHRFSTHKYKEQHLEVSEMRLRFHPFGDY